jgi:hypothetical protein
MYMPKHRQVSSGSLFAVSDTVVGELGEQGEHGQLCRVRRQLFGKKCF